MFRHCSRFFLFLCFFNGSAVSCKNQIDAPSQEVVVVNTYNNTAKAISLYTHGIKFYNSKRYSEAAKIFDKIIDECPISECGIESMRLKAICLCKLKKFKECIDLCNIFIDLHAAHKHVDYIYYIRGVSMLKSAGGAKCDQFGTLLAIELLNLVCIKFPDSICAKYADLRIDEAYSVLAEKNMIIAKFYATNRYYNAAFYRFKSVFIETPNLSIAPKALFNAVEIAVLSGNKKLLEETEAIIADMEEKYSTSKFTTMAKKTFSRQRVKV